MRFASPNQRLLRRWWIQLKIDGIHEVFCLPGEITLASAKLPRATSRRLHVPIEFIVPFSSLHDLRSAAALSIARFFGTKPKLRKRFTGIGMLKRVLRAPSLFGPGAEKP